jgi:hypothetical protein
MKISYLQLWKYKNLFEKLNNFFDIQCSRGDFSKIKKIVFKGYPHISWFFISCFHPHVIYGMWFTIEVYVLAMVSYVVVDHVV